MSAESKLSMACPNIKALSGWEVSSARGLRVWSRSGCRTSPACGQEWELWSCLCRVSGLDRRSQVSEMCPAHRSPILGTMNEARRDSTSSLQRKKPPWLRLDIPVAAPVEEPSFLQVGSGAWAGVRGAASWAAPHPAPTLSPCDARPTCEA